MTEPLKETAPNGAEDGIRCKRCQTANSAGSQLCSKCKCFLPGNAQARTHGGYGSAIESRVSERRARILAAMNLTAENIPPVLDDDIDSYCEAAELRRAVFAAITSTGALTNSGRVRSSLDVWERISARCERLAKEIRAFKPAEKSARQSLDDFFASLVPKSSASDIDDDTEDLQTSANDVDDEEQPR